MWRGVPKPVALADPSAGAPAVYVPSQGELEMVRAVTFFLACTGGGPNRTARVRFLDGQGVPVAVSASPFTVASGSSSLVSFTVGSNQFGANNAAEIGGPLYERWLDGLVTLEIGADAIAAGDTITAVRLDVCGYPVEWLAGNGG